VGEAAEGWRRTAVASLVVCSLGGALLARGTEGFRALTSEQVRRNTVARSPRTLPDVAFEDQDQRPFTLADYRGRPIAVDFVYTRCRSICAVSNAGFQRLDAAERSRRHEDVERLALVSISFDSSDTPDRLREQASRYEADGRSWRFARLRDPRQLTALLNAFGVIVIPASGGDFQHNAAVLLVDDEGRLARVLDADARPEDVASAVATIRRRDVSADGSPVR